MTLLTRRLDSNWDFTFGQGRANYAVDAEATAQKVKARLLLLQGEWFLDTSAGVPYLTKICVKPADLPLAEALIKRTILGTEGVAAITEFSLDFNDGARRLTLSAKVRTIYDDISTIKVNLL